MKYYAYYLRGGDVLFVPTNAPAVRYTPTASTEDQVELDSLAALFDHQVAATPWVEPAASTRTPKAKRRKQRHPRTPKKFWARRRLVMEEGLQAAAEAEGVSPQSVGATARRYGWDVARKRTPKGGANA